MNGKQLLATVLLSSLLTTALLVAIFSWRGTVQAQPVIGTGGNGRAYSLQNKAFEEEVVPTPEPAAIDDTTGDGFVNAQGLFSSAAPVNTLTEEAKMSHWFIIGSHLLPRDSALQYVYTTNGCIYISNAGSSIRMQFPVALPDRSVIKSMDVFYNDTSASNLTVWLTRYNPGQTSQDVLFVSSSGNTGVGSNSSSEVTHIVDNGSWAYSLNYSWSSVTNNTLQICGIRINYIDPFYSMFLPITVTP